MVGSLNHVHVLTESGQWKTSLKLATVSKQSLVKSIAVSKNGHVYCVTMFKAVLVFRLQLQMVISSTYLSIMYVIIHSKTCDNQIRAMNGHPLLC